MVRNSPFDTTKCLGKLSIFYVCTETIPFWHIPTSQHMHIPTYQYSVTQKHSPRHPSSSSNTYAYIHVHVRMTTVKHTLVPPLIYHTHTCCTTLYIIIIMYMYMYITLTYLMCLQLRRQARLRREYLYRKSVEDQERTILERKRKIQMAIEGN